MHSCDCCSVRFGNSRDFCSLVLFAVASYRKKYCNTYSTDGYDVANDDFELCVHVFCTKVMAISI